MSYLPCELHCHSVHSDGSFSVAELLRRAYDDHLALIALTDHNTVSGHGELDDSITPAVPGIEWTTFFGHMLVLGARDFVDWRDAVPANIDDKIDQVHAAGGLCGVAHPFQLGSPICTGGRWAFDVQDWNRVDYLEVWHDAFGPDNCENVPATELWKSLLDKGYHLPITYGRDWHRQSDRHFGVTYLNMEEPTAACALEAIRAGRTVVSFGAKFFFWVHRWGETYGIGDTLKRGRVIFSFFTDLHARRKLRHHSHYYQWKQVCAGDGGHRAPRPADPGAGTLVHLRVVGYRWGRKAGPGHHFSHLYRIKWHRNGFRYGASLLLVAQQALPLFVVRQHVLHQPVKGRGVVVVANVAQLVHHHIVYGCLWILHQVERKADAVPPVAGAKALFCTCYLDPGGGYAQNLAVIGHPRRQLRLGPAAQRFHFRFR